MSEKKIITNQINFGFDVPNDADTIKLAKKLLIKSFREYKDKHSGKITKIQFKFGKGDMGYMAMMKGEYHH